MENSNDNEVDILTEWSKPTVADPFKWWEKKRLLYNIIILPIIILLIIDYRFRDPVKFGLSDFFSFLIIAIFANSFYFGGCLFEIIMKDVIKSEKDFSGWRKLLFWLGIFFSTFVLLVIFFLAEFLK